MRKSGIISLIALLVALTGVVIALAAYFKRRSCVVCDDFDDAMMDDDEYFAAQLDEDEDGQYIETARYHDQPAGEEDGEPSFDE